MQNRINFEFIRYVTLNILGQMAYSCYTFTDTFFVSAKLGAAGLTALNLAFPVFCLINGTGLMLGMGGGARYAVSKSRRASAQGDGIFTVAANLAIVFAIVFFVCGMLFSEKLVVMLGADASMFELTNTYLKVMMLFAPAFIANTLLQCFIRNDGCPSLAMAAMLIGSASNILLDYIFIFPLNMGIFGAILATGLAPLISIAVLLPYFLKGKNHFHIALQCAKLSEVRKILSTGIPPFLTELTSGIVMMLFNFILLRISGNIGVAAFGIVSVISLVTIAIYTGLSQGVQPLLSRYYGAGDREVVAELLKKAVLTAILLSAMIYSVIFFGADALAALFNKDGDVLLQQYAVTGLKIYFSACLFIVFNIVMSTYFISTENPLPAQIISMLRGFILLIPVAFMLSAVFKMNGVWAAYPVTEAIVCVAGAVIYRYRYKMKK